MDDLIEDLRQLKQNIDQAVDQLNLDADRERLEELQQQMQAPDFWDDSRRATEKSREHARLEERVHSWEELQQAAQDALELAEMGDSEMERELTSQYQQLEAQFQRKEFELKLGGEYDRRDAIVSIHAGTGGTDAQDWAEMLERMYLRWAEDHQLQTAVLGESAGEEAGIKSATLKIAGDYAYGRLKGEHGVHRLVRQSPFDSDSQRHTSFVMVEVVPQLPDIDEVKIPESDLRVDTYKASGHGGQSVNTTDSAVRITHLPTGVVVAIQNERSQQRNKETAMTILHSRLEQLRRKQRAEKIEELKGEQTTEQWGQQIRNYVLHPYQLVKDTRTGLEIRDTEGVLDGGIDEFIEAYLLQQISE